jgi:hypothetical protein
MTDLCPVTVYLGTCDFFQGHAIARPHFGDGPLYLSYFSGADLRLRQLSHNYFLNQIFNETYPCALAQNRQEVEMEETRNPQTPNPRDKKD